jgi:hypothetical protein
MEITYYGQDQSYFSHLDRVLDILEYFDFIPKNITCVYDGIYSLGTEQYVIEGDDIFTLIIDNDGKYYVEYSDKTEFIGDINDDISETSHYIDVILNGPDEDLSNLFEGLIREDKRSDFFQKYLELPIEWEERDDELVKKSFFEALWAADLSNNKKYIPWFFKQIKDERNKPAPVGLDTTLRRVSEYMDFIENKTNQYSIDDWNNRIKNGDLTNYGNIWDKISKSPKDINSYPDINALREFYNHLKQFTATREQIKNAKKESKKIYEDSNYLIVQPLTHNASCVYGRETRWCVASKDSSRYFDDYTSNSKFYYVINKKGRDNKYSKFALRIPVNKNERGSIKSIEVWDQQDNRSNFDTLYSNMPGMDDIISNVLNINTNDYKTLLNFKSGKISADEAFVDDEYLEIVGNDLHILFESSSDYFETIFKYALYSHSISVIQSVIGYYGNNYEFFDSYIAGQDFEEGYAFESLSDRGKDILDKIVNLLNPNLFSTKSDKDSTKYYSEVANLLSSNEKLYNQLVDEYSSAMETGFQSGVKDAINTEYGDVMSAFGVIELELYTHYVSTVDNILKLYEDKKIDGKDPNYSIRKLLAMKVEDYGPTDVIENYWEYRNNDLFSSNWDKESTYILENFYDNLIDDEDGMFDDVNQYRDTINYIIKNFGFNVKKEVKTMPGTYMSVVSVEPDNNVVIEMTSSGSYTKKRYSLSLEQLESLMRNYKLF